MPCISMGPLEHKSAIMLQSGRSRRNILSTMESIHRLVPSTSPNPFTKLFSSALHWPTLLIKYEKKKSFHHFTLSLTYIFLLLAFRSNLKINRLLLKDLITKSPIFGSGSPTFSSRWEGCHPLG